MKDNFDTSLGVNTNMLSGCVGKIQINHVAVAAAFLYIKDAIQATGSSIKSTPSITGLEINNCGEDSFNFIYSYKLMKRIVFYNLYEKSLRLRRRFDKVSRRHQTKDQTHMM
ncbi:hypothetical protein RCL_jg5014.t1 [Rhizophagus clarus]|uniref:Uncharacterized protein n=1 Tax=Rhizophagus clarus TaxID=94130 RepID=A0A8H3L9M4_9GLOM|nr:hypothetical protein RCL_jg5014.t1 [Rhizophagus clarus]